MFHKKLIACAIAATFAALSAPSHAEAQNITFGYQFGWSYTPLHVMETQHLVEKRAKALGVDVAVSFKNLGSPGVIRDGMIAGQVQFGAVGVPTLISMADKTNLEWKAVGNIVSVPMNVNTNGPAKTLCDIKGKIALPTIKSSVQAVTLQIAAKKQCGGSFALDAQTVSMTHPDGMSTLLNGQAEAHFTSPPFNDLEIASGNGKVRKLADSYEILGGKTSFILLVGSDAWRKANPKAYQAVSEAFEEAVKWTAEHPREAASLYVSEEKSKESVDEVVRQMSAPTTLFNTTPNRIGVYSSFMKEIGTVKREMSWRDLSMPELHGRDGS
jgi:NitT/TauT family transport system substrate-binding protein